MRKVFEFLSRLASLIVICTAGFIIYNICRSSANIPDIPTVQEEEAITLPPPPLIITPPALAQKNDPTWWEKAVSYLKGPCHPILPSFIQAFNYRQLRSSVIPIIQDENSGEFNLGAICDVFDYLQEWKYIDDPATEDVVTVSTTTWKLRAGDCDDQACCLAAGLTTIGGITRVSFASNNETAHAWCEVCLGALPREHAEAYLIARYRIDNPDDINFREDARGLLWLNLDWSAEHPGGSYFPAQTGALYYPSEDRCESF